MRALLVLAVAVSAAVAPTSAAPAVPSTGSSAQARAMLELQVLRELNRVRAARGVARLRTVKGLRASAAEHSRAMLAIGFFAHTSADGTAFHERIRRHYTDRGWDTWSVAETLLFSTGETDAKSVVAAWLESPPHRRIIMSPGWEDAGIAALYRPAAPGYFEGADAMVVTADFGYRAGKFPRSRALP
ncbi:MAG TPA: CAP domain-containing protein [Gaiellaceae bacterium]|nr:CAP domain-containing protein [Gaiellaceae bacterium]